MTRRYARPLRQKRIGSDALMARARDVGNLALGGLVLLALVIINPLLAVWDVVRPGQGEAFRPSGGHRITRG